jgi:hypothetical protein
MSSKEETLRAELKTQIARFKKESDKHKGIYRTLRYTTFGLTGAATLLASAALYFTASQEWLNLAVVLATALAGVATSIEGLRKPSELWIHERNIYYALKDLERDMNYVASAPDGLDVKAVDGYFNRVQQILTSSTEDWSSTVGSSNHSQT